MIDPKHYAMAAVELLQDLDAMQQVARQAEGQASNQDRADYWHARLMLLTELTVAVTAGRAAGTFGTLSPTDLEG